MLRATDCPRSVPATPHSRSAPGCPWPRTTVPPARLRSLRGHGRRPVTNLRLWPETTGSAYPAAAAELPPTALSDSVVVYRHESFIPIFLNGDNMGNTDNIVNFIIKSAMLRFLAIMSVLAGVLVVSPARADAAGRPYIWTESADMFSCTSVQALCAQTTVTRIPRGTPLTMLCWRDDRAPFPGSSPRWFYAFLDNGQEGFVWSEQVRDQTPNTPNCSTVNWISVSDWAIGRIGLTRWRSVSEDGPSRPQNGPEWSGWCLGLGMK